MEDQPALGNAACGAPSSSAPGSVKSTWPSLGGALTFLLGIFILVGDMLWGMGVKAVITADGVCVAMQSLPSDIVLGAWRVCRLGLLCLTTKRWLSHVVVYLAWSCMALHLIHRLPLSLLWRLWAGFGMSQMIVRMQLGLSYMAHSVHAALAYLLSLPYSYLTTVTHVTWLRMASAFVVCLVMNLTARICVLRHMYQSAQGCVPCGRKRRIKRNVVLPSTSMGSTLTALKKLANECGLDSLMWVYDPTTYDSIQIEGSTYVCTHGKRSCGLAVASQLLGTVVSPAHVQAGIMHAMSHQPHYMTGSFSSLVSTEGVTVSLLASIIEANLGGEVQVVSGRPVTWWRWLPMLFGMGHSSSKLPTRWLVSSRAICMLHQVGQNAHWTVAICGSDGAFTLYDSATDVGQGYEMTYADLQQRCASSVAVLCWVPNSSATDVPAQEFFSATALSVGSKIEGLLAMQHCVTRLGRRVGGEFTRKYSKRSRVYGHIQRMRALAAKSVVSPHMLSDDGMTLVPASPPSSEWLHWHALSSYVCGRTRIAMRLDDKLMRMADVRWGSKRQRVLHVRGVAENLAKNAGIAHGSSWIMRGGWLLVYVVCTCMRLLHTVLCLLFGALAPMDNINVRWMYASSKLLAAVGGYYEAGRDDDHGCDDVDDRIAEKLRAAAVHAISGSKGHLSVRIDGQGEELQPQSLSPGSVLERLQHLGCDVVNVPGKDNKCAFHCAFHYMAARSVTLQGVGEGEVTDPYSLAWALVRETRRRFGKTFDNILLEITREVLVNAEVFALLAALADAPITFGVLQQDHWMPGATTVTLYSKERLRLGHPLMMKEVSLGGPSTLAVI